MKLRVGRRVATTSGSCLLASLLFLDFAGAQEPAEDDAAARTLIERVIGRATAADEVASIEMDLVEPDGGVRERTATIYTKKKDAENDMRLIRFHSPADLDRSGILTVEQGSEDADQWLYLPAYHASRRIAAANRSDTWMGTDFTYEDMNDPDPDSYRYRVVGHERVRDLDCVVIEAIPAAEKLREESGYSKRVYWVNEEKAVAPRVEFYDREGQLSKRLETFGLEEIDGHFRWSRWEMHDLKRDHRTVIRFTSREIDQGLSERFFTVRFLERGR